MTVAALAASISYNENGVSLNFAVPFRYLDPTNLAVKRTAASGVQTNLAYGSDWSATAGPTDAGGTLTLVTSVSGAKLTIERATPRAQTTDYVANDRFPAETHEATADRAMLIDQEQDVRLARAILVPVSEAGFELPLAASRAGKIMGFDAGGNPVLLTQGVGDSGLRTDLAATTGAALAGFSHANAYGQNTVGRALNYEINIGNAPYNAALNGTTDDTTKLIAAVAEAKARGGATIVIPGPCKVSSKVLVDFDFCTLKGLGDKSQILISGDNGDIIHAKPPSGNLQGFTLRDLKIYTTNDTTNGAAVRLENCNGFAIMGCKSLEHYNCLWIDGSIHGYIDCDLRSDTWFPALRSGSALAKFTKSAAGLIPAETHIDKVDWRGQQGNYRLEFAVLIQCADLITFDNPHMGFAKNGLALNPGSNSDPLVSIRVDGGYLDTCQNNLLQALRPSSSYSADWGLHDLDFAQQYNSGSDGWNWFCESTVNNFWSGIQLGQMLQIGGAGVNVGLGRRLNFRPGWSIYAPSNSVAGQPGILLNNTVNRVRIGEGTVEKGSSPNTPNAAVQVTSAVDRFRIGMINYENCTTGIADSSVTANKSIVGSLAW